MSKSLAINESGRIEGMSKVDPKLEARKMFNGNPKDLMKASVQDILDYDPQIRGIKDNIEQTDKKIANNDRQIKGYEKLRRAAEELEKVTLSIKNPIDITENAFARTKAEVVSNDIQGVKYISVSTSPGAELGQITVNVQQIATQDTYNIGLTDTTQVTNVNNTIQGETDITTLTADILLSAGTLDANNNPIDPDSNVLYQLAIQAASNPLATSNPALALSNFKTQAATIYAQMTNVNISQGFSSLTSAAVSPSPAPGSDQLAAGTYVLYSGTAISAAIAANLPTPPGAVDLAYEASGKGIVNALNDALAVYNAMVALPGGSGNASSTSQLQTVLQNASGSFTVTNPINVGGFGLVPAPASNPGHSMVQFAINDIHNSHDTNAQVMTDISNFITASALKTQIVGGYGGSPNTIIQYMLTDQPSAIPPVVGMGTYLTANPAASLSDIVTYATNLYNAGVSAYVASLAGNPGYDASKITVTLNTGDTLQDVVNKINAQTKDSGVQATTIKNGANSYILQISAVNTGTDNVIKCLDQATLTTNEFPTLLGAIVNKEVPPINAMAFIDGIAVMQSSNTIQYGQNNDVSITLQAVNSNTTVLENITISPNVDTAQDYIAGLTAAYNKLAAIMAQLTDTKPATNSLYKEVLDRGNRFLTQIKLNLSNITSGSVGYFDGGFNSLAQIGIKPVEVLADPNGEQPAFTRLEIDAQILKGALENNYNQVRRIFEFNYNSADPSISILGHTGVFNGAGNFQVTINTAGSILGAPATTYQAQVDMLSSTNAITATFYYPLAGPDAAGNYTLDTTYTQDTNNPSSPVADPNAPKSPIYGMILGFNPTVTASPLGPIAITYNQGIADKIFGFISEFTDTGSNGQLFGAISSEEVNITKVMARLQETKDNSEKRLKSVTDKEAAKAAFHLQKAMQAKLQTEMMEEYFKQQHGNQ